MILSFRQIYLAQVATLVTSLSSLAANRSPVKPWSILEQEFQEPPKDVGPYVLWQWMNGWISKAGIKGDIEAMSASGYAGAQIFNVGVGIPRGPVDYGTDEWLDMIYYAAEELEARDMKLFLTQSPGYSGAGGPWITPNMSMQQLVWTENRWTGDNSTLILQKPLTKLEYYEDVAVLAYPALPEESHDTFRQEVNAASLDGNEITPDIFGMISPQSKIRLAASSVLEFTTPGYFTAQAISIYRIAETPLNTFDGARDYPPSWTLSASNDSTSWTNIAKFGGPALRQLDAPAVASFPPTTYKYWRLVPSSASWVTGVELYSGPRLVDWAVKAHAAPGTQPVAPRNFSTVSSSINSSSVIDLTTFMSPDGTLRWNATGRYTIFRFGHTSTGQDIPATPDSATDSLAVDIFSSAAVDFHLQKHVSQLVSKLEKFIPRTLQAISIDSYELGMQTWTKDMAKEFRKYKGYDIGPWLLSNAGLILDSELSTEQYLYDMRSVHSSLVSDQYYAHFNEYAGNNSLIFNTEPYGDGPFDTMDVSSVVDSAYGEFWARYTYGSDAYSQAGTSAMHQGGYQINFAESFTGQPSTSRWTEGPYSLKAMGDRLFTLGVNRLFVHCYALQYEDHAFPGMTMGPFGAHFDRKITWTKQATGWSDYIKRSQLLLQQSESVSEIACFVGEEPVPSVTATYSSPCSVPLGYGADIIGVRRLLQSTAVNGRVELPSGYSYKLIIFPEMPAASLVVIEKIKSLQDAGVSIILQGAAPSRALGRTDSDEQVALLGEQTYAQNTLTGLTAAQALQSSMPLDFKVSSSSNSAAVYAQRRISSGKEVYFVSNGRREYVHASIALNIDQSNRKPRIWYPDQGVIAPAIYLQNESDTQIALNLLPSESLFIVFDGNDTESALSGLQINGSSALQADAFPSFDIMPYKSISSNFTITFWAKPETYRLGNVGYVYYPPQAVSVLGSGHAATGFGLGTNGFIIVESTTAISVVYSLDIKVEGWSHFAIVYHENIPSVYINGVLVGTGSKSTNVVHPGVDTPDNISQLTNKFEGDIGSIFVEPTALTGLEIKSLYNTGTGMLADASLIRPNRDGVVLLRANGHYEISRQDGSVASVNVTSIRTELLEGLWNVSFPRDSGISQDEVYLMEPSSLRLHSDFDVAHFSGTATWSIMLQVPEFSLQSNRILIDFNRIENIGKVYINGKEVSLLWKAPWEVDITKFVLPGELVNLTVEVTNFWPNRMIGDESLPAEATYNTTNQNFAVLGFPEWFVDNSPKTGKRVTFSSWASYTASDPLFDSGILGPVQVTVAEVRDWH